MDEGAKLVFCDLLAMKISEVYGVDLVRAKIGVLESGIQRIIDEDPEYVDHIPLLSWAQDVYAEMILNKR